MRGESGAARHLGSAAAAARLGCLGPVWVQASHLVSELDDPRTPLKLAFTPDFDGRLTWSLVRVLGKRLTPRRRTQRGGPLDLQEEASTLQPPSDLTDNLSKIYPVSHQETHPHSQALLSGGRGHQPLLRCRHQRFHSLPLADLGAATRSRCCYPQQERQDQAPPPKPQTAQAAGQQRESASGTNAHSAPPPHNDRSRLTAAAAVVQIKRRRPHSRDLTGLARYMQQVAAAAYIELDNVTAAVTLHSHCTCACALATCYLDEGCPSPQQ